MFQMTQSVHVVAPPNTPLGEGPRRLVTNAEVAEVLFNIATLLEMQRDNPYRVAAYRNAARGTLAQNEAIADIIARGDQLRWPGLGERLRRKIAELVRTGHMMFYDELCESSLPQDARELMTVPHIGPKTALRLVDLLDIHSVAQLLEASQAHRLRQYYRFGARSEQRLADSARAVLAGRDAAA
ncbi:MAG TPA: helix-hairpin-helix domain-containing protein [Ktedonobacterales bacterium]|jgi:DNA polymerase (family 10)|nr:helix-hairpin-helix domain-containing protein [Ktedonobacterales bacterium]